jgi:FtsP/CotA-like multicopper oxidase with cupredoxin domain
MHNLGKRLVTLGFAAGTLLHLTPLSARAPSSGTAWAASSDTLPHILSNDNRRSAGRLRDGVLTVRLEARNGSWYAEGSDGLARAVSAFAEEGGPLQIPGPLIRVPVGTEVRVSVRNSLAVPLTLYGLAEQRGVQADTFQLEPGATREMRFRASAPGLYYYSGLTEKQEESQLEVPVHPVFRRAGSDSQLNGVIVVDSADGGTAARDRFFVITRWGNVDTTSVTGVSRDNVMVINGLSWPHTERFEVTQGDSLHWRWVNLTPLPHPMHLHGFYFLVDGRGDGVMDTAYAPAQRRAAVTELLLRGQTMTIAWSPERPGNWIFHCHIAAHMSPPVEVDQHGNLRMHSTNSHSSGSAQHAMARLVLGIRVKPNGTRPRAPVAGERAIRLLVRSRPARGAMNVRYAYVLGGSAGEADPEALPVPGPTLVLEKGRPVAITIVNQAHEPAAVHWHGIELESFPDGVPDWSGMGSTVLRAIPVRDSLTVRFTPPRAGTFMYHSHFNELQQISSGLYGAIVVRDPGVPYDPETDRVLLFSDERITINPVVGPFAAPMLNGLARPEPIELRAGVTYRFRLVNIRSLFPVAVALLAGDRPVEWRHVAKDGAELPPAQAVRRPAQLVFAVGEIHDVEFTPSAPGDLTLRFGYPPGFRPPGVARPEPVTVAVRVR